MPSINERCILITLSTFPNVEANPEEVFLK